MPVGAEKVETEKHLVHPHHFKYGETMGFNNAKLGIPIKQDMHPGNLWCPIDH